MFVSLSCACPHLVKTMEGETGSQGDSRPESPGSGSVDLTQLRVRTPSPSHSVHRRVSPARSVDGFSQTEGMSEEMRFKLEIRRMELEKVRDTKRLEVEKERELRKLQLQAEAEERSLKTGEAREARRLETEKARLIGQEKEMRLLEAEKEKELRLLEAEKKKEKAKIMKRKKLKR